MNRHVGFVLLGLVVLLPAAAGAQTSYIPAAAHVLGYGGTVWRSDLEVKSCNDSDAEIRIEALQRGRTNPTPLAQEIQVEAGETVRIDDALSSLFHLIGAAAFRITPVSGCAFVTSRTYNDTEYGTYGQYVPAIPESEAFDNKKVAQLIQLSQSDDDETGYRTAIGLINLTDLNIRLTIQLYSSSGRFFGPLTQNLGPYEYIQLDKVFRELTFINVPDGYATISTITPGGKFLAYASVVDNRSGDAIFIPAQGFVPEAAEAPAE